MWKLQALVLLSIVFTARHDDVHIAPSVSAGTVSPAPRPRADAWGYLDRQWIGFHHTLVGRRFTTRFTTCPTSSAEFLDIWRSETARRCRRSPMVHGLHWSTQP